MKPTIWYAGVELKFRQEFVDEPQIVDDLQAQLDYFRKVGKQAACLHEGGKHQLYVA